MTNLTYPYSLPEAQSAAEIIARMRVIVQNERLEHMAYVREPDEVRPAALCGGHRFCAIGAAWFAAGAEIKQDDWGAVTLEGISTYDRDYFAARTPYLSEARAALNRVAQAYMEDEYAYPFIDDGGADLPDESPDALERFFECRQNVTDSTLLAVIDEAATIIEDPHGI